MKKIVDLCRYRCRRQNQEREAIKNDEAFLLADTAAARALKRAEGRYDKAQELLLIRSRRDTALRDALVRIACQKLFHL